MDSDPNDYNTTIVYLFIYFNFKLRVERKECSSPICLWGVQTDD